MRRIKPVRYAAVRSDMSCSGASRCPSGSYSMIEICNLGLRVADMIEIEGG
jgi:hypothetical protein